MLNKFRYLDILLFNLKTPISVDSYVITQGWNQLVRKDKTYYVKQLGHETPYLSFPVSAGHLLLEKISSDKEES